MKIAVISMIRDSWGGSEELWYDMAKTALGQGHEIVHLSYAVNSTSPKLQELINLGLVSYKRPSFYRSGGIVDYFRLGLIFFKKRLNCSIDKIFTWRPDAIIYNGTCHSIAEEKKLLRYLDKYNARFYIIAHLNNENSEPLPDSERQVLTEAYSRSRKTFFFSRRTKSVTENQLSQSIQNGKILRNPVNLKETSIVNFPGTTGTIHFALPANLVMQHKGQDILLKVFSLPTWSNRDFHLNLYGTGQDRNRLEALTKELGLTSKVTFHGFINDVRELWKKNHLLVMPSRMEGMPLALVEAMLCGRPAVVTDVGGASEWIEEAKTGFIAEAADCAAFDRALEKAWQVKERWAEMGRDAHERASQLYDPQAGKTLLDEIAN